MIAKMWKYEKPGGRQKKYRTKSLSIVAAGAIILSLLLSLSVNEAEIAPKSNQNQLPIIEG